MKALLLAIVVLGALSFAVSAQKTGGYKTISTSDAKVREAAEFAVDARAERKNIEIELISVEKAESQVVAGVNYQLCLKVTMSGAEDEADITTTVQVIVHRDLKGKHSLTSWLEEDCAPEDDG